MQDLNLNLTSLANILRTDVSRLSFTILVRKASDFDGIQVVIRHPAVLVKGIHKYVFDLVEGVFVTLSDRADNAIYYEKKTVFVQEESGILLRDPAGHSVRYTEKEFLKLYGFRVVNPILFPKKPQK
jgi:hypothetical protein